MNHMFLVARPGVMLIWGPGSPFSPGERGHGSLYSWENGDPGPHITGRRVTPSPHYPRNMGIPWWKWGPPVWLTVFPGVWGPSVWQVIIAGIWGSPEWLAISPSVWEPSVWQIFCEQPGSYWPEHPSAIVCYRTVYNSEREVPTNALATHSHSHWCSNHCKGCDGFHLPFSEVLFSSLDFLMKDIATGYFPLPVGQVLL